MDLNDRAAAFAPYAQQLVDNQDVQAKARQAASSIRGAYERARGQDARKAVEDRKLRRRVTAAVTAVGELLGAASKTAPKRKPRWPRWLGGLGVVAAGAWMINNQGVRAGVQGLWKSTRPGAGSDLSPDDQTTPIGAA